MKGTSLANPVFFAVSFLILTGIVFTAPEEEKIENNDKETLALLFGGAQPAATTGRTDKNKQDTSLYDTEFWKAGVKPPESEEENVIEEDDGILEKVSEGNPINPQTGLPYTDEQMAAFEKLREKFPNNSLIPRRQTAEEKQKEEEYRRRMLEIQSKISVKKATPQEIEEYYEYQKKPVADRIELLQYVLKELEDELTEEMKKQYQEVLRMNERQLQTIEEQKRNILRSL